MIMIARSIGLICIIFTIPRRPHPWRNTFYQSLRSFKLVKSSSLWFHQFHTTIPSKCATTAAGSHEGGAELNFGARWCWEIRILGIEDSKTLAHKTMMTFLKIPRVNPVDKFQLPSEAAATDKHHLVPNSPYHLYGSLIILQHLVTSPSSKQLWVCFPYFGASKSFFGGRDWQRILPVTRSQDMPIMVISANDKADFGRPVNWVDWWLGVQIAWWILRVPQVCR